MLRGTEALEAGSLRIGMALARGNDEVLLVKRAFGEARRNLAEWDDRDIEDTRLEIGERAAPMLPRRFALAAPEGAGAP